ncbi:hypothetical protein [Ruegeria arenilitoris]|uniref:hypothetical protein n=1 Tax=Ruegeria arenilitoris TaxID=1173585 RepID=UPI00147D9DED|nr:hypothetical protein [Ruegeria arenilitoris]
MPRNRTPIAKAKMTGADKKHPERFGTRTEPDGGGPLGNPPEYFNDDHRKFWFKFQAELPWLVRSDRAMLEVTCITRAQIEAGGENVTAALMREHRQQLSSLGATPVTRSNVVLPPADRDEDDPFAQFMTGPKHPS